MNPNNPETQIQTIYPVVVDYDISLEEAIIAGGYDMNTGIYIVERFPKQRTGKEDLKMILIPIDHDLSDQEIVDLIEKLMWEKDMVCRPPSSREFLAFGAKHPEAQREGPITNCPRSWMMNSEGDTINKVLHPEGVWITLGLWADTRGRGITGHVINNPWGSRKGLRMLMVLSDHIPRNQDPRYTEEGSCYDDDDRDWMPQPLSPP